MDQYFQKELEWIRSGAKGYKPIHASNEPTEESILLGKLYAQGRNEEEFFHTDESEKLPM